MKFLSDRIGDLVVEKLGTAVEAHVAVAFFSPSPEMLAALMRLNKLTLIISEEFTITNPYVLEKLEKATLRSIRPDQGKLLAKVFIVKQRDGSCWALVGSANLTSLGMSTNQEACVEMHSESPSDRQSVLQIRDWFDALLKRSHQPNLEQAKSIFDSRSGLRLVQRPSLAETKDADYWALKPGENGDHWGMFLDDRVILVGWANLDVDPSKISDSQLRTALRKAYPQNTNQQVNMDAANLRKFVSLKTDDIVLICSGYDSNQRKDVHVYGFARVVSPFRIKTRRKGEWKFKHDAVIQVIEEDVPRDVIASALKKESMRQTIHHLEKAEFGRLAKKLADFGVHLGV